MLLNTGADAVASQQQPADDGRVAARRTRWTTRSKAACSSPARSCNGCATGCGSSAAPPRSRRSRRACPTTAASIWCPAFAGLGAPHWDPYARGAIFGLTRGATRGHIARAALEAIAFQSADVLDAMERRRGRALTELRVDGGAAANNLLMQFQADVLGVPVVRPQVLETTALGAAYLAGLAVGYWTSTDDIGANWRVDRRFEPAMPAAHAAELRANWDKAVARTKGWA